MTLKEITLDFIIDYCQKNNETEWLKNKADEKSKCKVYPRVKKDGKSYADKTAEPTIVERKISFIEIRNAFVFKFMPDIAPSGKPKKPSMYDRIKAL